MKPQIFVIDNLRLTKHQERWRLDEWSKGQYWKPVRFLQDAEARRLIKSTQTG